MIRRTLSTVPESAMSKIKPLVVSDWSFAPTSTNSQGLLFSQISHKGEPVTHVFEAKSHFDMSAVGADGASRTPGLMLQLSREAENEMECVMSCCLHHVTEHASDYGMVAEQVESKFKPCFVKNGLFPANLRVKTAGVRYWAEGALTTAPSSHVGCEWTVKIHLKSLWFAPDAWGISCTATDMQEHRTVIEYPF